MQSQPKADTSHHSVAEEIAEQTTSHKGLGVSVKRARIRRAVTLLEVMAVIVIIGILSALAIPKYMSSTGLSQLDADANLLHLTMRTARTKAVVSGRMTFIRIDTATRSIRFYRDNGDNTYSSSTDTLIRSDTLGVSVRFGFGSNWTTLPATSPEGTKGFSDSTVPRGGMAPGVAGTTPGTECAPGLNSTASGSWGGANPVIYFCPGVLGDIETGALYLSSTRSNAKAHAILYNDLGTNGDLKLRSYVYQGGSWSIK